MRIAALLVTCLLGAAPAEGGKEHPLEGAPAILGTVTPIVERIAGAELEKPLMVRQLDPDAARRAFCEDLRGEVELRYPDATEEQRRTLLEAAAAASIRSCVARYSCTLRRIVLVRVGFDEQVRRLGLGREDARRLLVAAMAHECVHALDDARFDLLRLRRQAGDAEARRALSMIVEGRASHLGRRAALELEVPEAILAIPSGGGDPGSERQAFLRLAYRLGERFVAALAVRGGLPLVDRAFREPPRNTHFVCHPDRWPDGEMDERPTRVLSAAYPGAKILPLSELELRARYAAMDGTDAAEDLFRGFRGGVRALVGGANAAVAAFSDEAGAKAYLERSLEDVPAKRAGTLVVRAAGEDAGAVVDRLALALESADGDRTGTDR